MIKLDTARRMMDKASYRDVTDECCPSFSGIVAGECAGELWVDNWNHPRLALAYSYPVGGYAFLGNFVTEEVWSNTQAFMMEEMLPRLKAGGVSAFEFSIESEALREPLLRMFAEKTIQQETEFRYRKSDTLRLPLRLPDGLSLQAVDDAFWRRNVEGLVENAELLSGRLLQAWGSYPAFAERSLAYSIMDGQRIIAVIVGTARFNDVIPIDIEVEADYRCKSLGLVLAQAFVNGCAEKGLTAEWDCVESNPASQKVAAKAGFSLFKESDVFWFSL